MKKEILVFAIALLLIGMFSPIVSADLTLTSEFVEPVKNASFEDRDNSIPGDGVYSSPPWNSNNGGWRDLRGDVDSDGDVDYDDLVVLSGAYGTVIGDPNYDWRFDLDGDGDIDYDDLVILSGDYGKTANSVDGAHSWYTSGGGDYLMWQYLDSDTLNVIKGKQAAFTFWFFPESVAPDGSQNYARAEISLGGSNYVYGDWVYPNQTKWHSVFVTATIPSDAYQIIVLIHGKPDFKAYIDFASLTTSSTAEASTEEGNLALSANIVKYWKEPQMTYDGRVLMSVALFAESKGSNRIYSTKLQVELLPIGYDWPIPTPYTTQDGKLHIEYVEQTNDKDYDIDPATNERLTNMGITAAEVAIKVGGAAVGFIFSPGFPTNVLLTSAVWSTTYALEAFKTNPDQRDADPAIDWHYYEVHETWIYWLDPGWEPDDFVSTASGYYELEWIFNTDSATSFQIRIIAALTTINPFAPVIEASTVIAIYP